MLFARRAGKAGRNVQTHTRPAPANLVSSMVKGFHVALAAALLSALIQGPLCAEQPASSLDPRAQKLILDVNLLREKRRHQRSWFSIGEPWTYYLADTYVEQLRDEDKERYYLAVARRDCDTAISLQTVAFLKKHPFLSAAHERPEIKEAFKWGVVGDLPDIRDCINWRRLAQLLNFMKKKQLEIPVIGASVKAPSLRKYDIDDVPEAYRDDAPGNYQPTLQERATNSLCWVLHGFSREVIYRNSKPAIISALRLTKRPNIIRYSTPQLYYLYRRAEQLNALSPDDLPKVDILHHNVQPRVRFQIESFLENPEAPGSSISAATLLCGFPRLSLRDWMTSP